MDTEKHIQLQHKIRLGKSPSDEGPYYHHAWWESYKGSVKGKLGGLIIGALVGSAIGAVVAGALAFAGAATITIGVSIAAFAAAGMMYGVHEFGDIGKVVGSGAAQSHQLESRLKTIVKGEVATVKEKINELEAHMRGAPIAASDSAKNKAAIAEAQEQEMGYRKSHYAKLKPEPANSFAFWKVALIGLAVGAIAGALLAVGGPTSAAAAVLGHIIGEKIVEHMAASTIMIASVTTMGALGATFGLNRDLFRKVFDKTDLWFKGVVSPKQHAKVRDHQIAAGEDVLEAINGKQPVATAIIPDSAGIDYPKSETHFRDKVLPAAQRALLSFDHTRATPQ